MPLPLPRLLPSDPGPVPGAVSRRGRSRPRPARPYPARPGPARPGPAPPGPARISPASIRERPRLGCSGPEGSGGVPADGAASVTGRPPAPGRMFNRRGSGLRRTWGTCRDVWGRLSFLPRRAVHTT